MPPSSSSSPSRPEKHNDANPYVIVADMGKGSFATVYKGYHEVCSDICLVVRVGADTATQETRLQVALKAVKRDKLSAKLFDNLQSEIQILKSLSHRHVTRLLDIVVRSPSWATRVGT